MATGDNSGPFSWSPAFPFMYGLSYTTFDVAPLNVSLSGSIITASVRVTNTGARPAKQVVGVFFSKPLSSFVRNHLSLLAFAKTGELAPGGAELLQIDAPVASLSSFDPAAGASVVEKGVYDITVRTDAATVVENGGFTITI